MYHDKYFVDVLFFIEHKDRELEEVGEIAKKLKSDYGLSVAIVSTIFHSLISALFISPKVLVSPSPNIGKGSFISLFREIYGNKITYVNLNIEQFLSSLNKSARIPKDSFEKLQFKQFCWGTRFKEFLLSIGVPEENIYVTGKPAITRLLNKAYGDKKQLKNSIAKAYGLNPKLRWLFFPMSCGIAFSSDYHMKTRIKSGWDEKRTWVYRDYTRRTLTTIFKWIAKLNEELDDKDFLIILRPHPSVSVYQYEEHFKNEVGEIPLYVYISKMLTAQEWLIASDVCYATLSTVAFDANIIRKPVFRLAPEPFPPFLQEEDWLSGLPTLTSFSEFSRSIQNRSLCFSERLKVINEYIDLNFNGVQETAKYLAKFANERNFSIMSPLGFFKAIVTSPRRLIGSLIRLIAAKLKINLFGVIPFGLRTDYFNRNDVLKLLR